MKRLAIIKNSIVDNCVNVPDDWTGIKGEWTVPPDSIVIESNIAGPGDNYDGTNFIKPTPVAEDLESVYNQLIQDQRIFRAYVIAMNKGTIIPGGKMTATDIKAAIKVEM